MAKFRVSYSGDETKVSIEFKYQKFKSITPMWPHPTCIRLYVHFQGEENSQKYLTGLGNKLQVVAKKA